MFRPADFLIIAVISFGAGIFLSSFVKLGIFVAILPVVLGFFFLGFFFFSRTPYFFLILSLVLLFSGLGIFRFAIKDNARLPLEISDNFGERIIIEGVVLNDPERSSFLRFVFEAEKIIFGGDEKTIAKNKIIIFAERRPEFFYGDRLRLNGVLMKPRNRPDFNYADHLAKDDIFAEMRYPEIEFLNNGGVSLKKILFGVKRNFLSSIAEVIPEPNAGILAGLILGEKSAISNGILDDFRRAGLIHILVLSGYNIAIVAANASRIFNFYLSRTLSAALALIVVLLFVVLSGAEPPAVRAGIMAGVAYLAGIRGRLYEASLALLLAGFLMLVQNPKILRFDASFQLSFFATAGLIFLVPRLKNFFEWIPKTLGLQEYFLQTISAQLAVFPLLLYSFGQISLVALPANLLVLPVIPATMFLGLLTAGLNFIHYWLALLPALLTNIFLGYEVIIAKISSAIPLSQMTFVELPVYLIVIFYVLIALFVFIKKPNE